MQKNKHLDLRSRVLIQNMLDLGTANLTTIAKTFGKKLKDIEFQSLLTQLYGKNDV